MESIAPVVGSLPGFEAYPHPREGYTMTFRGNAPNDTGEPEGEYVEVELVIPPLSFHQLQQLQAKIKAREGAATAEQTQSDIIDTICLALKRNYRGVPRWLVEQSLDGPIMTALNIKMREMNGITDEKQPTGTASP